MPYLIKVITGKEKRLITLFSLHGIDLARIPVSEYLICNDPRCQELRHLDTIGGYIRSLHEITDEEALALAVQKTEVETGEEDDDIAVGKIVTVAEGEYEGQSGIVKVVGENEVKVDMVIFGRMHTTQFARHQVKLAKMPEVWR